MRGQGKRRSPRSDGLQSKSKSLLVWTTPHVRYRFGVPKVWCWAANAGPSFSDCPTRSRQLGVAGPRFHPPRRPEQACTGEELVLGLTFGRTALVKRERGTAHVRRPSAQCWSSFTTSPRRWLRVCRPGRCGQTQLHLRSGRNVPAHGLAAATETDTAACRASPLRGTGCFGSGKAGAA